jgi:DNA-directed RNA polymerase specialized sigma24 family protein
MPIDERGSVSIHLSHLKSGKGDDDAFRFIWNRYYADLVRMARRKLEAMGGPGGVEDDEDAATAAFASVWKGAKAGRFGEMEDRTDLCRMMAVILSRKVFDQVASRNARRRAGGRIVHESALAAEPDQSYDTGFALIIGPDPSPEDLAIMEEQFRRLLESLGDDTLRSIVLMKADGYTDDEIANAIDRTRRTVQYKLNYIRTKLMNWGAGST